MSESSCVIAHRRDPDKIRRVREPSLICKGCAVRLERELAESGWLLRELELCLVRPAEKSEIRGETALPGLNLDQRVIAARHQIRYAINDWARIVAEERHLVAPSPDRAAAFLQRHNDWITAQPWIDEMWTALVDDPTQATLAPGAKPAAMQLGRALIQPNRAIQVEIPGKCPETNEQGGRCNGRLTAIMRRGDAVLPNQVSCDACGMTWSADEWHVLARRLNNTGVIELVTRIVSR
jgi:hypothetical protein